jgi:hypothetical protein
LGIITNLEKFKGKPVHLYALCYDYDFRCKGFNNALNDENGYINVLSEFKQKLVAPLLTRLSLQEKIKFHGYLSAKKFVNDNEFLIGENLEYVEKRYFGVNVSE